MTETHWIRHLVGAPPDVTIHHYTQDGFAMSAIYEGEMLYSEIERCGEAMMINHYRHYRNGVTDDGN